MDDIDEGEEQQDGRDFEILVVSIRRWILGLGGSVLCLLLLLRMGRPVILGFCTGWLLSLFSLDHMAWKARQVRVGALSPAQARVSFISHYLFRWTLTVAVIVMATKLGANPVAAVAALLLLQAAIVCSSMVNLLTGGAPGAEVGGDGEDGPDPGPETVS